MVTLIKFQSPTILFYVTPHGVLDRTSVILFGMNIIIIFKFFFFLRGNLLSFLWRFLDGMNSNKGLDKHLGCI